jgi:hypothetical protein
MQVSPWNPLLNVCQSVRFVFRWDGLAGLLKTAKLMAACVFITVRYLPLPVPNSPLHSVPVLPLGKSHNRHWVLVIGWMDGA